MAGLTIPHVIAVGSFGDTVAERILALTPASVGPPAPAHKLPQATAYVIAAVPPISAELRDLLVARMVGGDTVRLPVLLDHPRLRIGPVVVPGGVPCRACCERYERQYSEAAATPTALEEYYRAHPEAGPSGYLPSIALFAAAAVVSILTEPRQHAGQVREYRVVNQQVGTGRVTKVPTCSECRGRAKVARAAVGTVAVGAAAVGAAAVGAAAVGAGVS